MQETIDLIAHREMRNLRAFTRETGQPTRLADLDLEPMTNVQSIEIDEEHVTMQYNTKTERRLNVNEITRKEWIYKYNGDPEFVAAVARVIELARKHHVRPARQRGVPARLRRVLQRLRAVRQRPRRAAHRRPPRPDVRRR